MQMHLAEKDLNVSAKHKMHINPVEKGHIAFRTDDLESFLTILKENKIEYADYGTAFAKEWHQVFFMTPREMWSRFIKRLIELTYGASQAPHHLFFFSNKARVWRVPR